MNKLSPDCVVLGLLAIAPCHGYRLLAFFHDPAELGQIWRMSTSQLYVVLKRLEQRGWVTGQERASADAPARTEYRLTESGRASLYAWLHEAQPTARVRSVRIEFLSRLYIARALGVPTTAIVKAQQRVCLDERARLLAERDKTSPGVSFLALEFMIMQLDAVLQWIDRCVIVPKDLEET